MEVLVCDQLVFPVSDAAISRRDKGVHAELECGCGIGHILSNVEIPVVASWRGVFESQDTLAIIVVCLR